jgi:thiamine-phosphate pyrophosphorylase
MTRTKGDIRLYLVTDEPACMGRDFYWVVEEAVKGGVSMVQLREKSMGTRAFIERAKRLMDLLHPYQVPLIINDRVDVALAVNADGVHVGQSDMPYEKLKDMIPPDKIIGVSAEKKENVFESEPWDISYLAVSPLFATPSKTDTLGPWGMNGLKWVSGNSRHRLVVIGGLNSSNSRAAIQHGAHGIAVISTICGAPSPGDAARNLLSVIQNNSSTDFQDLI